MSDAGNEVVEVEISAEELFALVDFRQATAEDINFIKKTWLTSLRLAVPVVMPSGTFYPNHEVLIGNIANDTPCWIACDREHPFYIYGWACGTPSNEGPALLHYIFVRPEYRRRGLAKALAEKCGWEPNKRFVVTHLTHFVKKRWYMNMVWDWYVLARYVRKVDEDSPSILQSL